MKNTNQELGKHVKVEDMFQEIVLSFDISDDDQQKAIALYRAICINLNREDDDEIVDEINNVLLSANIVELKKSREQVNECHHFDEWQDEKENLLFSVLSGAAKKRNKELFLLIEDNGSQELKNAIKTFIHYMIVDEDYLSNSSLIPPILSIDPSIYEEMEDSYKGKKVSEIDLIDDDNDQMKEKSTFEALLKIGVSDIEAHAIVYNICVY